MDTRKILARVPVADQPKERITVTVSKDIYETFKSLIKGRAVSPVIDEMMRDFVESESAPQSSNALSPVFRLMDIFPSLDEGKAAEAIDLIEIRYFGKKPGASSHLINKKKGNG